jgi:hypothetical protein
VFPASLLVIAKSIRHIYLIKLAMTSPFFPAKSGGFQWVCIPTGKGRGTTTSEKEAVYRYLKVQASDEFYSLLILNSLTVLSACICVRKSI